MNRASTTALLDSNLRQAASENPASPKTLSRSIAACLSFFQIHGQSDFVASDLQSRLRCMIMAGQKSLSEQINDYVRNMEDMASSEQVSHRRVQVISLLANIYFCYLSGK